MKPRVFIASSSDDLLSASTLAERLRSFAEVLIWTTDVFTLAEPGRIGIQRFLKASDFAVFIAGFSSNKGIRSLRPAFLAQLRLSIASIGAERTILLLDKRADVRLSPNLQKVVLVTSRSGSSPSRLRASFAVAARTIERHITKLGIRQVPTKPRGPFRDPFGIELRSSSRSTRPSSKEKNRRTPVRSTVFISYAHGDKRWLAMIQTMLDPLVRADRIAVWDDTRIKPGTKWQAEIKRAIRSARVALLLVSPRFLASAYIAGNELPPILDAARRHGLVIVWALVSASMYTKTPIAEYQAAHPLTKPLDTLSVPKRNQALLSIAEKIEEAFQTSSDRDSK